MMEFLVFFLCAHVITVLPHKPNTFKFVGAMHVGDAHKEPYEILTIVWRTILGQEWKKNYEKNKNACTYHDYTRKNIELK